jgi:hypothetical protein
MYKTSHWGKSRIIYGALISSIIGYIVSKCWRRDYWCKTNWRMEVNLVAEQYIEDSVSNKIRLAEKVFTGKKMCLLVAQCPIV